MFLKVDARQNNFQVCASALLDPFEEFIVIESYKGQQARR